jgi:hypothetical protein
VALNETAKERKEYFTLFSKEGFIQHAQKEKVVIVQLW